MKQENLFSAMESSVEASVERFNDACNEVINASYVIASGKINKLLITIASCKPLFKLLEGIIGDYNFIIDFEKCKFRDEKGTPYLQPPTDPCEQIRFAFCLLFAIDTGKLELKNLLSSFYKHSNGANYEYELFCTDVVLPFKTNILNFMTRAESAATNTENLDPTQNS